MSASVAALLEQRGITLYAATEPTAIENGLLRTSDGAVVPAELTAALPVIRPRTLAGVRTDADGFIPVDDFGRVTGIDRVFAAGDCTNERVKQGGLAAQQADAAAAAIAALAGVPVAVEPYTPQLHAVLLTGETPLHLHSSGARPIDTPWIRPQPAEKIVARHLTSYLAQANPSLLLETIP